MRRRESLAAALALLGSPTWVRALAEAPSATELAWLARLRDGGMHGNFHGTLVHSTGGAVSSTRVAHYGEGGQQYERMEMLDGQMRRVFRHNDQVVTLWPERKLAVVEQRESGASMPALLRAQPTERLFEAYELRAEGTDRVAGHEARVWLLHPRDALRFAQRLWLAPHGALPLRVELLASDGRVLESTAFSELVLNVRPQPETVLKPMRKLEGYRVLRPVAHRVQLDAEGWSQPAVPGFEQISCVKRLLDEAAAEAQAGEMLQAVYADGLTHVSLFIEPLRGDRQAGHSAIGATHTLMQRHGAWWLTVVGEVPPATLQKFAAALARRSDAASVRR